ncbi:MAG: hypothetical protein II850_06075 [Fibrobacter sp.]|uniref:hypothetical protein n=1 Tax=unclassified Fibrobacter TaxID=2634177 RepID=UPI001B24A013|nr:MULTISPECIES: hypothetical protein [unclassified Fibrobacter]MBO6136353.1 hypothetical protein [Fibrobacter sp.]MBQ3720543.1 hypothetical protein [Fibrobacter sp.]
MQISEKIFKAVEFFKKKDLWAKIAFTIIFLSYLSCIRACFNPDPMAADTFPIYENGDKNLKQCELDGKKLFLEQEFQNNSFWYNFFVDSRAYHVWHLQYQDDDNIKKNILTYKFAPSSGGIGGGVVQGTGIGIDERQDSIVFFYDAEPLDGFTIEVSPFSDKVVIQKVPLNREIGDARCFKRWSN